MKSKSSNKKYVFKTSLSISHLYLLLRKSNFTLTDFILLSLSKPFKPFSKQEEGLKYILSISLNDIFSNTDISFIAHLVKSNDCNPFNDLFDKKSTLSNPFNSSLEIF